MMKRMVMQINKIKRGAPGIVVFVSLSFSEDEVLAARNSKSVRMNWERRRRTKGAQRGTGALLV